MKQSFSVTCHNCGREFEPKRKTAVYCSAKCRVYASRNLTAPASNKQPPSSEGKPKPQPKLANDPKVKEAETQASNIEREEYTECPNKHLIFPGRQWCEKKGCQYNSTWKGRKK